MDPDHRVIRRADCIANFIKEFRYQLDRIIDTGQNKNKFILNKKTCSLW